MAVSAQHGLGTGDLLDRVTEHLDQVPEREEDTALRLAVIGRPNVGKSSLVNRFLGEERVIVSERAGTTRDAIDTRIQVDDRELVLVDTAGLRRRSKVAGTVDYYAQLRSEQAAERADVALVVCDASEGVTSQDLSIAELAMKKGCATIVVLNKWDLLDAEGRAAARAGVTDRLAFLGYAPVLTVSAATGRMTGRILPALRQSEAAYHTRIPTAALNRVVREAQARHPAPSPHRGGRQRPRVLYATQGAADPPTFTLFATHPLPPTYLRYLERRIREAFSLGPTPIQLRVRRRNG